MKRPIFDRSSENPILTSRHMPFPADAVLNPGATEQGDADLHPPLAAQRKRLTGEEHAGHGELLRRKPPEIGGQDALLLEPLARRGCVQRGRA